MSSNPLTKISPKTVGKAGVLVGLLILVVLNIRVILENMLKVQGIDEKIVSEANPRLNRTRLREAIRIIENSSEDELTSIFPFARVGEEELAGPIAVEIHNASGINGAAADVAQVLTQQGYQVSALFTAPSLQDQTIVFHRIGLAEESRTLSEVIRNQGWQVIQVVEAEGLEVQIRIVLGRT